jgi:acetyl-CoA synthetase
MDAEDPLFILYTSVQQFPKEWYTTAGYIIVQRILLKMHFNIKENDDMISALQMWIETFIYIVYGPLQTDDDSTFLKAWLSRFWTLEYYRKHKVNQFYTAPTAIRALAKQELN